ncbi:60s ribosomal protein l30 [Lichtheimia corymbifera JMRC:FSU:9682]|uniref:60s ribosomal protein l30 n=3 Tax=Lichtheimia TaxID=688353 RepID=A0A068S2W7_9FUNG|nr:60s ribosomal protein l30 [Lichtheimia corymbifera JMRC:FSU:9682]
MPQIYDLKRFTQNAYAGSHYQAHLLLQAIDINRRERLSDCCLEHLAHHVAESWESADKAPEISKLMKQLLDTTAVNQDTLLEHALDRFCNQQDTSNAISTVCPSLTLLIAISYIDRLNQNYANFKGTDGCAYRLVVVAYMIAAKYMRANLRIIHFSENQKNNLPPYHSNEADSRFSRLEIEFLHFLNYNLFVEEPEQLVWWAKTWEDQPVTQQQKVIFSTPYEKPSLSLFRVESTAMAPAVKKSKKNVESINSRLQLVTKSGKYTLGYKSTLKTLRQGKAKLIVIAGNCPPLRKSELEYYAMLSKTGVHHYNGNNIDLGTACGKLFRTGVLSITDAGDSDILSAQ